MKKLIFLLVFALGFNVALAQDQDCRKEVKNQDGSTSVIDTCFDGVVQQIAPFEPGSERHKQLCDVVLPDGTKGFPGVDCSLFEGDALDLEPGDDVIEGGAGVDVLQGGASDEEVDVKEIIATHDFRSYHLLGAEQLEDLRTNLNDLIGSLQDQLSEAQEAQAGGLDLSNLIPKIQSDLKYFMLQFDLVDILQDKNAILTSSLGVNSTLVAQNEEDYVAVMAQLEQQSVIFELNQQSPGDVSSDAYFDTDDEALEEATLTSPETVTQVQQSSSSSGLSSFGPFQFGGVFLATALVLIGVLSLFGTHKFLGSLEVLLGVGLVLGVFFFPFETWFASESPSTSSVQTDESAYDVDDEALEDETAYDTDDEALEDESAYDIDDEALETMELNCSACEQIKNRIDELVRQRADVQREVDRLNQSFEDALSSLNNPNVKVTDVQAIGAELRMARQQLIDIDRQLEELDRAFTRCVKEQKQCTVPVSSGGEESLYDFDDEALEDPCVFDCEMIRKSLVQLEAERIHIAEMQASIERDRQRILNEIQASSSPSFQYQLRQDELEDLGIQDADFRSQLELIDQNIERLRKELADCQEQRRVNTCESVDDTPDEASEFPGSSVDGGIAVDHKDQSSSSDDVESPLFLPEEECSLDCDVLEEHLTALEAQRSKLMEEREDVAVGVFVGAFPQSWLADIDAQIEKIQHEIDEIAKQLNDACDGGGIFQYLEEELVGC